MRQRHLPGVSHPGLAKPAIVAIRVLDPPAGPCLEVRELDPEHGGLQGVEPTVPADHLVLVGLKPSVGPQLPELQGKVRFAADGHPAIPEPPEVLGGEEGIGTDRPEGAGLDSPPSDEKIIDVTPPVKPKV